MTMPRLAPVQLFTNALLDMLAAEMRVGDHEVPKDRTFPYSILYQLDDAPPPDGPVLTGPEEDLAIGFQITSVGSGRKQAQWQADRVRRVMVGRNSEGGLLFPLPIVAGWTVAGRLGAAPGGVAVEGSAPTLLFQVPDRYTLHVTPDEGAS